ncbi:hypothetical protein MKEN_00508500 [Mycena kentingensis (nom. inval.)]|nr:hypothetical protein MKEN_00508500 [Mycena kentingensis (nom. inval.)]
MLDFYAAQRLFSLGPASRSGSAPEKRSSASVAPTIDEDDFSPRQPGLAFSSRDILEELSSPLPPATHTLNSLLLSPSPPPLPDVLNPANQEYGLDRRAYAAQVPRSRSAGVKEAREG